MSSDSEPETHQLKATNPRPSTTKEPYHHQQDQFGQTGQISHRIQRMEIQSQTIHDDEQQINKILKGLNERLEIIEDTIARKENEKLGLIDDVNVLTHRLKALNKSVIKKRNAYENYDKLIRDAENAFSKIVDSTKTLVQVVKKENAGFGRTTVVSARKFDDQN